MVVEWWSIIPFVLMLLSIAVLPLVPATEHVWEKNSTKLTVALVLGVPVAIWFIASGAGVSVVHARHASKTYEAPKRPFRNHHFPSPPVFLVVDISASKPPIEQRDGKDHGE